MTNSNSPDEPQSNEEIDLEAKIIGKDTVGWSLPAGMDKDLKEKLGGGKKNDVNERSQKMKAFMKKMDDTAKGHE